MQLINRASGIVKGGLYVALGAYLFAALCIVMQEFIVRARMYVLPSHDYLNDVQELHSRGMLSEAEDLADFAITNSMTESKEKLIELRAVVHTERTAVANRAKRFGGGFVYGEGNSPEEMMGAITSDMFLYGDVRDLIKQGYYKATGQETDKVIVALSSIGVLTEFVDAADWAPAVLKACRKMKCLTEKFSELIVKSCKKSVKARRLDDDIRQTFSALQEMNKYAGVSGTVSAMKYVDRVEDLTLITKYSKKAAIPTSLILKAEGVKGLRDLDALGHVSAHTLTLAAKAAKRGCAALCSTARMIRRIERIVKAVPFVNKLTLWALTNLAFGKWIVAALSFCFFGRGMRLIKTSVRRAGTDSCAVDGACI